MKYEKRSLLSFIISVGILPCCVAFDVSKLFMILHIHSGLIKSKYVHIGFEPQHPPPQYEGTNIIFERIYGRDIFCELLSIKETQRYKIKKLLYKAIGKFESEHQEEPWNQGCPVNYTGEMGMDNFRCRNSSVTLFLFCN